MGNDASTAKSKSDELTCNIHLFGSSYIDKLELVAEFCHDDELVLRRHSPDKLGCAERPGRSLSAIAHSACDVLARRAINFEGTAVTIVFHDNYTASFRGADALLVVFDSTDRKSFTFARKMIEHLQQTPTEAPHSGVVMLVGNSRTAPADRPPLPSLQRQVTVGECSERARAESVADDPGPTGLLSLNC